MNQLDNLCRLAALISHATAAVVILPDAKAPESSGPDQQNNRLIRIPVLNHEGNELAAIHLSYEQTAPVLSAEMLASLDLIALEVQQRLTRRQQELELEQKRSHLINLDFVASKVNNAIVINDPNNHVTWVNEAFEKITGFTLEDLRGRRLGDLIAGPKTDLELIAHARRLNRQNQSFTVDLLAYRKDKQPIWLSIYNSLIHDETGKVSAEVEIIIDITDKKLAEQEMLEKREQALQLSATREMFVSVMSHEIRTPLNAIVGMTHLLMENNPKPEQLEDLKILRFSSKALLHIVNDVLDFTKIESGNLQLESIPFSLPNLAKDMMNSLQVNAGKKGNTMVLALDERIPEKLMGDPTRLYQILMNLLGNASKFTSEGTITLELRLQAEHENAVVVHFKVQDTGIGIPADKLEEVFESFAQAKPEVARMYGGTGLGLSITKKLLKLFGADIVLQSKEGEGSSFSFQIAFDKVTPCGELNPCEEELLEAARSKRILVVDDNELNLMIAKRLLSKWGLQSEVALSGKEAITRVREGLYDLVLMDVKMPEMDGYEAARLIRELGSEYFKTLPIVALTAASPDEDRALFEQSGMSGHLRKPLDPEALKRLVNTLV